MTPITTAWLEQRGMLHDAKVVAAYVEGASVCISINDEWANAHDGTDGRSAGVLVFYDASIIEGDLSVLKDGWISEVEHRNGNIFLDFCDRDRLVIIANTAMWEPNIG